MESRLDRAVRRRVKGGEAHAGRSLRAHQDSRAERKKARVRLVCRLCRGLIHWLDETGLALAYRPEGDRSTFVDGELVTTTSRPWRCPKCARSYPVTYERMRAEYAAALERGDRVVELPL